MNDDKQTVTEFLARRERRRQGIVVEKHQARDTGQRDAGVEADHMATIHFDTTDENVLSRKLQTLFGDKHESEKN